ncbi:MAG: IS66 family transposase [Kiritimatiellia bacterium]|jgi:transposase|nr:IS66 family transposase [Eubacteriales bacterium]MDY0144815.1 IS66 family transposase [Kiritimatiellia bacterium]
MKLYTEKQLQAHIQTATAPMLEKIAELEQKIARLEKNSSNSSKPPSSDIVKPPKGVGNMPKGKTKRKRGGQKGHPRHERKALNPEEVTVRHPEFTLDLDPTEWEALDQWETHHQLELKETPLDVHEYRARLYRNRLTGEIISAGIPNPILAGGIAGPRLSAFVGFLKGRCHTSYTTIETLMDEVFGHRLCRGTLAKIVTSRVSPALAPAYDELLRRLPSESYLGIDETGHKDSGDKFWTWCFRAPEFTFFRIDQTRSTEVLRQVLGSAFDGVISCDYYSAYLCFMKESSAVMQFCLAHLIRDVKFLAESGDKVTRNWAMNILDLFRKLFSLIHRKDELTEAYFQKTLIKLRDQLIKKFRAAPPRQGPQNLRDRFKVNPKKFFTFVTTPGVQPTNNFTEQAIRYLIIDRRITQGTRGQKGRKWCERIWTSISTCEAQNRSTFQFLCDAVTAHFNGLAPPSLMPAGP